MVDFKMTIEEAKTGMYAKLTIGADQYHHLFTILDLGDFGDIKREQDNFKTAIGYAHSIGLTHVYLSQHLKDNYSYTCKALEKEAARLGILVF